MRISLLSDCHYEFGHKIVAPSPDIDVLVLAGDTDLGRESAEVARKYQKMTNAEVVFISGNHEPYKSDIDECYSNIRAESARIPSVHFLEKDVVIINGVRFLGCTLWSDFSLFGIDSVIEHMNQARRGIADYWYIQKGGKRLQPEDTAAMFQESYQWLDRELSRPFNGKTVVVTHFSPHRAAIHPKYLGPDSDGLTPYFNSDCARLMRRHAVDVWMFGHTHCSIDKIVEENTRLVSNQMGYPSEPVNVTGFDPHKVIQI